MASHRLGRTGAEHVQNRRSTGVTQFSSPHRIRTPRFVSHGGGNCGNWRSRYGVPDRLARVPGASARLSWLHCPPGFGCSQPVPRGPGTRG
jgi:hypothetical protein